MSNNTSIPTTTYGPSGLWKHSYHNSSKSIFICYKSLLVQVLMSKFSRSSTGFIRSTCPFHLHESSTIKYYTRSCCHLSNLWPMPRLMCVTWGTLFRHTDILSGILFRAAFPKTLFEHLHQFTENTDICCYKEELLMLLVFLTCREINRFNDFPDFRLSTRSFQQFLLWYDSYCVVRNLLVPEQKKTKQKKNNSSSELYTRVCFTVSFLHNCAIFFFILSSCHR